MAHEDWCFGARYVDKRGRFYCPECEPTTAPAESPQITGTQLIPPDPGPPAPMPKLTAAGYAREILGFGGSILWVIDKAAHSARIAAMEILAPRGRIHRPA